MNPKKSKSTTKDKHSKPPNPVNQPKTITQHQSKPQILQVLQLKTPISKNHPNLIFKINIPAYKQPVYVDYQKISKNYPQTLIQYLTKFIVVKDIIKYENKLEQPQQKSDFKPILDCDQSKIQQVQENKIQNKPHSPVCLRVNIQVQSHNKSKSKKINPQNTNKKKRIKKTKQKQKSNSNSDEISQNEDKNQNENSNNQNKVTNLKDKVTQVKQNTAQKVISNNYGLRPRASPIKKQRK